MRIVANTFTTKSKHRLIPVYAQDGNLYADDDKPILKSRAEYWYSDVFNRQKWADLAKKVGMDVGYF